jgi:hypothetical protein
MTRPTGLLDALAAIVFGAAAFPAGAYIERIHYLNMFVRRI